MPLIVDRKCLVRFVIGFGTLVILAERIPSSYGQNHYKHNSISRYYSYKQGGISGCIEPGIEVRERNASAIFTGTIRDVEVDDGNPEVLRAKVEVKRVMKGGHILSRLPHSPSGRDSWKTVVVDGIGSGEICRSFARKHDTRIFLVNKGSNGELKLNSSLERITLSNIEKIESALRGENQATTTTTDVQNISSDHSSSAAAAAAATTDAAAAAERPHLTRHDSSSNANDADLRSEPPIARHNSSIKNREPPPPPPTPPPDPCRDRTCLFGGKCAADPVTGDATCRCVEECGAADSWSPVCGSDGMTYDSECHLQLESCSKQMDITIHERRACDPCRDRTCLFGGKCAADPVTGGATCRCVEECGAADSWSPVCGSDGMTYASECHLQLESCSKQMDITVHERRACELKDPCSEKRCSFGARCVASLDGLTARCQCPQECHQFGDSVGGQAVCGSDGQDYENDCEMKKTACELMTDIERKFDGKCDPCEGFECSFGQLCQLDIERRPVCRCGQTCPMIFEPICASNGKTYANECLMTEDACRHQTEATVLFHAECSSGVNPCSDRVCGRGEQCRVDPVSLRADCSCPGVCPQLLRPVCGSDGRTYDTECHLRRSACTRGHNVTVSHHGSCDKTGPCANHRCTNGGHCVIQNGRPVCACPACSEEYEPVCGSDNYSYPNECKLQLENCKEDGAKKTISVRYRGRCLADICAQKKCHFFSVCEIDEKGASQCVCTDTCEQVIATVCGSDGVTYNNECELQHASCKEQKVISIVSNGSCDRCEGVTCDFGATCDGGRCVCRENDCPTSDDVVCASNGVTYPNECTMDAAGCRQRVRLTVQHPGSCDEMSSGSGDFGEAACDETNCRFDGICERDTNGTMRCSCSFNCDALRSPVCGSDGKTYGNECQLKEESCRRQTSIKVGPTENCEDIDEDLCDGEPALSNPVTGREYDCNRGKDMCPAGSYCHKLGTIARCCKEDRAIQNCVVSKYGCCQDGLTSAPGPSNAGCPNVCQCNTLGSLSATCDPITRQCTCRPGVGGVKCDRCNPNFWGLPKIAEGNSGCLPCGCNIHGSMRDDCEQMTGRCMCRPGITGQRCNICPNGKFLGPTGCSDVMLNDDTVSGSISRHHGTCAGKVCGAGAVCQMSSGEPVCVCALSCPAEGSDVERMTSSVVCGSDGMTYASVCQMKIFACRTQSNVTVARQGRCQATSTESTTSSLSITVKVNKLSNKDPEHRNPIIGASLDYPPDDAFVYGMLGDGCQDDGSCSVANSACENGVCSCRSSWKPSFDRLSCTAVRRVIPSFSGHSYLELRKFSHGSRDMSIELNFQPQREDGLLFYAAQFLSGAGNDFISLALKDGFVEFRYDLGSGQVLLKSVIRAQLGRFHRVTARRSGRYGSLKLDGGTEVSGTSPGQLRSLNLNTPIYLGYSAASEETLKKNVGIGNGFVGCVESVTVKSSEKSVTYDLTSDQSADIERRVNVGNCGTSLCSSFPCLNGGICLETDDGANLKCRCLAGFSGIFCENRILESDCASRPCGSGGVCQMKVGGGGGGGYTCHCHPGYEGDRCERVRRVISEESADDFDRAVSFDGLTFFRFQNAISVIEKSQATNKFEIRFRRSPSPPSTSSPSSSLTSSSSGLLLLLQKSESIEGDYLAIALNSGRVQVSFNLGRQHSTDVLFLTSPRNISDDSWHTLVFARIKRRAQLYVDDEHPIATTVTAPGATHLDTDGRLWIGGSRSKVHGLPEAYSTGFRGCIQYVKVNDQLLNLVEDREDRGAIAFCGA